MKVNTPDKDPKIAQALQEAAQWLIKIEIDQSDNGDDYVAFMNWLQMSPENERLYDQCRRTWEMSEILSNDTAMSSLIEQCGDTDYTGVYSSKNKVNNWRSGRRVTLMALCASVVLAFATVLTVMLQPSDPLVYRTAIGEQLRVELEDGSSVLLNTSSKISVLYTSSARHVNLEKGEALFDVAKDLERPFVVDVGQARVEVLGTLFNVRKGLGQVAVTLAEGKVRLSQIHNDIAAAFLSPGEQAIIRPSGVIDHTHVADVERVLQWTSGKLVFIDAALEDVIFEVNRYSNTKIYIIDPAIKEVKINAYFHIENIGSLLFALENSFNIKSHKDAGGIYLTRIR